MAQLKLVTLRHEPPSNEHRGQMNSVAMVAERGPYMTVVDEAISDDIKKNNFGTVIKMKLSGL